MDLTALQTRCRTRFRDANQAIVTNAEWLAYLNDAYQDVQAADPHWPWMETRSSSVSVTANARSATLPTGAIGVTAVRSLTDKIKLEPLDGTAEHIRAFPDVAGTPGIPRLYRVFGRTLEVYPVPAVTTTLEVEYNVGATELASGTDEPAFKPQYHRILVEGALVRAYIDDGAPDQAALHQAAFDSLLADLRYAELGTRTEHFPAIVDSWYGRGV